MKTLFAFVAAVVLLAATERPAQAVVSVSVEFFYDSLAPYGDWVEVEGYGYCFRPTATVSDPGWRPYTEGSWIYTDAGWTWESEEDIGWATYHYGRWFLLGGTWMWVPGDTWGPAWVSWRTGENFIGWAPLPPEAVWQPDTGFNTYVDVDYDIGPACYNFIPIRSFGELRLRRHLEPWQKNTFCMRLTVNHTRIIHRSSNRYITLVFNEGPELDRVSRVSNRAIRRMKLSENEGIDLTQMDNRLRNWSENDRFRVIAPKVERRGEETAPKLVRHRFDRSQVNRGWDGYRAEEVEDLRAKVEHDAKRDRSQDDRVARTIPTTPGDSSAGTTAREGSGKKADASAIPSDPQATAGTTAREDSRKKGDPTTTPRDPRASKGATAQEDSRMKRDPTTTTPRDPQATTTENEELRKAVVPGREKDERVPIGPGEANDLRKAAPVAPGLETNRKPQAEQEKRTPMPAIPGQPSDSKARPRPMPPEETRKAIPGVDAPSARPGTPDRFRTEPQDTPPRATPRTSIPGETGNSQRNEIPKALSDPGTQKPGDNAPPSVTPPPPRTPPPVQRRTEPEARKLDPKAIEPPKSLPKVNQKPEPREPRPNPTPTPPPPGVTPPPEAQNPSAPPSAGGGKKSSEEDDKKKKPR